MLDLDIDDKERVVMVGHLGSSSLVRAAAITALVESIDSEGLQLATLEPDQVNGGYNIDIKIKSMGTTSPYANNFKPKDRPLKDKRRTSRKLQGEINKKQGYGVRTVKDKK